jgi:hypothetical protein
MKAKHRKAKEPTRSVNIINNYTPCAVNVEKIVKRIVKYTPNGSLKGLKEIAILDEDPRKKGFASYWRELGRIELYIKDIIGWQPWIIRKTYIIPYLSVGLALGHEIDHHVTQNQTFYKKENRAESNAYKYIYPSFGILKPLAKLLGFFFQKLHRTTC